MPVEGSLLSRGLVNVHVCGNLQLNSKANSAHSG